ncbi:cold-shock protein [Hydrogenophaga pseudoflava]|uniref:cold-shock protein n=1 Tax=Hydrogenophaga pseudoflava TaxID=47421 RepID=UPI0027E596AA|nr:hypothetical protein [Hydrogenophaga pseudoflava]MDQ7743219.1 hypothetical protein [Hydrogenophaga pseudoflava]
MAADQGGQELFVHVSAYPRDGRAPVIGESLSFELELDKEVGWLGYSRYTERVEAMPFAPQSLMRLHPQLFSATAASTALR